MLRRYWIATCCLSVAIASFSSLSATADVLLNSGFEDGTGSDADFWDEIIGGPNGTVGRSELMPRSGDYSAYIEFDNTGNPAGGAYFIEQVQPVGSIDPTLNYDLSFWAKSDSTDFTGTDMFFQILWLDQDGSDGGGVQGEVLTSLVGLGIDTTYQQFGLSNTDVPDTADSFLLRFQVSAGAVDNVANGLYIDDGNLSPVPEPSTLSLLAVGGLAFMFRRRRN